MGWFMVGHLNSVRDDPAQEFGLKEWKALSKSYEESEVGFSINETKKIDASQSETKVPKDEDADPTPEDQAIASIKLQQLLAFLERENRRISQEEAAAEKKEIDRITATSAAPIAPTGSSWSIMNDMAFKE